MFRVSEGERVVTSLCLQFIFSEKRILSYTNNFVLEFKCDYIASYKGKGGTEIEAPEQESRSLCAEVCYDKKKNDDDINQVIKLFTNTLLMSHYTM